MFRTSLCPSSGATTTAVAASGLPSELGDNSAVGRGRARPDHDQQHCYHHAPTVKPEAATAVVELLMKGVRTSETCWAVHKRQVINLRSCCIWLVDTVESKNHFVHAPPCSTMSLHLYDLITFWEILQLFTTRYGDTVHTEMTNVNSTWQFQ